MARGIFLLALVVVAFHGIVVWPHVDAVRPKKLARARQSEAAALDDTRQQQQQQQDDSTSYFRVTTPYSATEQEVAQFMSSGGLSGVSPLSPPPPEASSGARRGSRKGRGGKAKGREAAPLVIHDDAEVGLNTDQIEEGDHGESASRRTVRSGKNRKGKASDDANNQKTSGVRKGKKILTAEADQNTTSAPDSDECLEEEEEKNTATIPFYLLDVPPTKVGRLFQDYEKRYWEAREEDPEDLGKGQKFFRTKRLGLTDEERDEFRGLVQRFTSKLNAKAPCQKKHKENYRLKRYGPSGDPALKTEAQRHQTWLKGRRTYLMTRLKKCISEGNRAAWMDNHDRMLQEYVAEVPPLDANDQLVVLYKDVLAANEGMESCIDLPED